MNDSGTSCANRGTECNFLSACTGLSEKQPGNITRGDKQQQTDRREQKKKSFLEVAEDYVVQLSCVDAKLLGVVIRIDSGELAGDDVDVGGRGLQRDVALENAGGPEEEGVVHVKVESGQSWFGARPGDGKIHVSANGLKTRRHDAEDGACFAVEHHRAAQNVFSP